MANIRHAHSQPLDLPQSTTPIKLKNSKKWLQKSSGPTESAELLMKIDTGLNPDHQIEGPEQVKIAGLVAAAEPAKAAESVETVEPVQSAEPVKTTNPVQTAEPVEAVEPVQATERVLNSTQNSLYH